MHACLHLFGGVTAEFIKTHRQPYGKPERCAWALREGSVFWPSKFVRSIPFFFSVLFVCFLARNSSLSLFVNIVPATFNFASHVQRNSYAFFLCLTLAVLFIHLPETTMVTGLRLFSVTKFLVLDLQHLHQFFQRFMRKIPVMWPSFHSNLPEKSLPFLDRSGILSHRTEVIVGECAWLKVGLGRWENGE